MLRDDKKGVVYVAVSDELLRDGSGGGLYAGGWSEPCQVRLVDGDDGLEFEIRRLPGATVFPDGVAVVPIPEEGLWQ